MLHHGSHARGSATTLGQEGMEWTTKVENQNPETAVADTLEREELAKRGLYMHRYTRVLNVGYVDSALAKQGEGVVDVDIESEAHTIDDDMTTSPEDADKRGNPQETAVAAKRSASVAPSVASTRGHWSMRSGSPRSCSRDPTNEGPPMKGSITKSVFVPKMTQQKAPNAKTSDKHGEFQKGTSIRLHTPREICGACVLVVCPQAFSRSTKRRRRLNLPRSRRIRRRARNQWR